MVVLFSCFSCKNENTSLDIGPLKWVLEGGNQSVILNSEGRILLGPGMIELWGEYPYIYGDVEQDNKYSCFLYDLRTKTLTRAPIYQLKEKYSISIYPEQFKTFQSLRGQHGSKLLYDILQQSITGKKVSIDRGKTLLPYTDRLTWKQAGHGESVILKDGEPVLGPGHISLWGSYPYIYGKIFKRKSELFLC